MSHAQSQQRPCHYLHHGYDSALLSRGQGLRRLSRWRSLHACRVYESNKPHESPLCESAHDYCKQRAGKHGYYRRNLEQRQHQYEYRNYEQYRRNVKVGIKAPSFPPPYPFPHCVCLRSGSEPYSTKDIISEGVTVYIMEPMCLYTVVRKLPEPDWGCQEKGDILSPNMASGKHHASYQTQVHAEARTDSYECHSQSSEG